MNDLNQIGNENSKLDKRPTMQEVDDLAMELCVQFSNKKYFKWYCSIIWKLGIPRVLELRARVSDVKLGGRLFTKYVNEDLRRIECAEKKRVLYAKAKKPTLD